MQIKDFCDIIKSGKFIISQNPLTYTQGGNMIGFRKKREKEIISPSDLLRVDPSEDGFYEKVLNYTSKNNDVQAFIEAIHEVQKVGIAPFYRPVMDPSFEGGEVVYKKGNKPGVGRSYTFWRQEVKELPVVEGKNWKLGTPYQYYVFLTWLINQLVETGWDVKKAIEAVVIHSEELGHYLNSKNAKHSLETTGSRPICGVYDLANTWKILCSNEDPSCFWFASGSYNNGSGVFPIADISHGAYADRNNYDSVGWLVLA